MKDSQCLILLWRAYQHTYLLPPQMARGMTCMFVNAMVEIEGALDDRALTGVKLRLKLDDM